MKISVSQLVVCQPYSPASVRAFVEFWGYRYFDPNDISIYEKHIRGPHTAQSLHKLFRWKFGHFQESKRQRDEVNRHFVNRRNEAAALVKKLATRTRREFAADFLGTFRTGGAIRRIFWLHCWNADFPLYDRHVHRAMTYIVEKGQAEELATIKGEDKQIACYVERYLPFFDAFPVFNGRLVDKALWQFGKALENGGVPKPRPIDGTASRANGCESA